MFDRQDICAAYYMYSILWGHDDFTAGIGRRLRALRYRPSRSEEFLEKLSPNAKAIYGQLVKHHQGDFVAYERLYRRAPEVFGPWPGSNNVGRPRNYMDRLGIRPEVLDCWGGS